MDYIFKFEVAFLVRAIISVVNCVDFFLCVEKFLRKDLGTVIFYNSLKYFCKIEQTITEGDRFTLPVLID